MHPSLFVKFIRPRTPRGGLIRRPSRSKRRVRPEKSLCCLFTKAAIDDGFEPPTRPSHMIPLASWPSCRAAACPCRPVVDLLIRGPRSLRLPFLPLPCPDTTKGELPRRTGALWHKCGAAVWLPTLVRPAWFTPLSAFIESATDHLLSLRPADLAATSSKKGLGCSSFLYVFASESRCRVDAVETFALPVHLIVHSPHSRALLRRPPDSRPNCGITSSSLVPVRATHWFQPR